MKTVETHVKDFYCPLFTLKVNYKFLKKGIRVSSYANECTECIRALDSNAPFSVQNLFALLRLPRHVSASPSLSSFLALS